MPVTKNVKYGIEVYEDIEGEAIRNKICLCLHCTRLVTQEDVEPLIKLPKANTVEEMRQLEAEKAMRIEELKAAYNCPVAQANYSNCVAGGVAAPITRCPMFVDKSRMLAEGEHLE